MVWLLDWDTLLQILDAKDMRDVDGAKLEVDFDCHSTMFALRGCFAVCGV
jgi:hypothetical protein